ncbi:DUF5707 domain-containing protein [Streptomyces sp. NPDC044780]|uniref:DUF5707 domain-containing protein n=1 Tax=Streptomyces luomodiensis TaxID=3026192 RepID=A0ABY9V5Y2_9ACTN|nr:DUF5707 domain-containing protein [Streptomyces sp. SCA4-21]WNF00209.1 DUF5707 domain-containing protein [Streptomyces sp. SCA4-21]
MSKRVLLSSCVGAVVVGGGVVATTAWGATAPTLANTSVRYVAPSADRSGSLTFTADVHDDSGVADLKVLAWPASSKLDPTESELRSVESATCRSLTSGTSRCTYTVRVTRAEATEGTWYVSALATGGDGNTAFVSRAAEFQVTR